MASVTDKGLYGFGRGIGLSKEDVDNGVAAFNHYDKDASGSIDVEELKNVFLKLSGPRVNPTLIEKYTTMKFQASDSDGSGEIEIREFLGLFAAFLKERNIKLSDNFAAELQNEAEAPGTTERDLVDREAMLLAEKEEKERAETARIEKEAREKAEKEQADRERAEREKAAREQAEQERKARDKLEAERENQQREAARKKAESEKAEKEKAAQEKAERDRAARNKAEKERKELEKAEKERAEREKAEKERSAIKAAQQTKIEAESVERELPRVLFGDSQTFFDEKNQFFNKPLLISTIRQIVEESTFHLLKRIDFLEKQVAELKSTKKEERISAFTPKDIIHIHSENESSEEELEDDEERNGTAARPSANEKQAADFFGKILGGSKGGPQAEVLESIQLRTENLELKNKLLQLEVELMKSKESNALAVAAVPADPVSVSKSQSVEKKVDSGIIGLNIGGKIFTASRKALLDSPAKKYFNLLFDNPVLDSFGNYFIDRSGKVFSHVLANMRGENVPFQYLSDYEIILLHEEATFYGMQQFKNQIVDFSKKWIEKKIGWKEGPNYQVDGPKVTKVGTDSGRWDANAISNVPLSGIGVVQFSFKVTGDCIYGVATSTFDQSKDPGKQMGYFISSIDGKLYSGITGEYGAEYSGTYKNKSLAQRMTVDFDNLTISFTSDFGNFRGPVAFYFQKGALLYPVVGLLRPGNTATIIV